MESKTSYTLEVNGILFDNKTSENERSVNSTVFLTMQLLNLKADVCSFKATYLE